MKSLVLVTGIAGDSALPDGGLGNMHSYLSQHFSDAHRIVFNTVESSAEDVMITVPDLRNSALNLLQSLDRNKAKLEGEMAVYVTNYDDGPKKQVRTVDTQPGLWCSIEAHCGILLSSGR